MDSDNLELKDGDLAPDFELVADDGSKASLSSFRGSKVVLYFYPKDMTSGCTKGALAFRDAMPSLEELGAVVLGVSRDRVESHRRFKEKYSLNFLLLSDPDLGVHKLYGVWREKRMYGRTFMGTERSTFIIGRGGRIRRIFRKVKVSGHVEQPDNASRRCNSSDEPLRPDRALEYRTGRIPPARH